MSTPYIDTGLTATGATKDANSSQRYRAYNGCDWSTQDANSLQRYRAHDGGERSTKDTYFSSPPEF
jgi:hypothetical protein